MTTDFGLDMNHVRETNGQNITIDAVPGEPTTELRNALSDDIQAGETVQLSVLPTTPSLSPYWVPEDISIYLEDRYESDTGSLYTIDLEFVGDEISTNTVEDFEYIAVVYDDIEVWFEIAHQSWGMEVPHDEAARINIEFDVRVLDHDPRDHVTVDDYLDLSDVEE